MSKIKLVFFDFDGVVLDSANIKTKAFPQVFEDYPEHLEAITQYHIDNQGISRYEKFDWFYRELLGKEITAEESENLGNRFSEIVLNEVLKTSFIPGALELLNYLKTSGIRCVVASGTPYRELHTIVEKRELNTYFEEVWGSPKSKESIVNDCLHRFEIKADEALFLGDATTDFYAAQKTQVNFQAVNSPELHDFWIDEGESAIENLEDVITNYFK